MPNTVRRPDDDRRRWEAQRRRQREEAERGEQAGTSRDRRQRIADAAAGVPASEGPRRTRLRRDEH